VPKASGYQRQNEPAAEKEGDLENRVGADIRQCGVDRLEQHELHVGPGDVTDRDQRVSAVQERDSQNAGVGAHDGEGLLGSKNREEIAPVRAVDGRARPDIPFGVRQQSCPPVLCGAAGKAVRQSALPIRA